MKTCESRAGSRSRVESREPRAKSRLPETSGPRPSTFAPRLPETSGSRPSALAPRPLHAFTLLELLVVIAILGILGALTVPVLKNFGKADTTIGASRQLLDDVARARQLAISQRTTVYMVFIPTNFWVDTAQTFPSLPAPNTWWGGLTPALRTAVTNLADRQLSGYTFIAYGAIGDQPGQHAWHYLAPWQGLPDNSFIAWAKFTNSASQPYTISDSSFNPPKPYPVYGFNVKTNFPFPAETGTNTYPGRISLPYIAFNYLGQLTFDGQTIAPWDEYIPLAHGSVTPLTDQNKTLVLAHSPPVPNSPNIQENPPGNSTNSAFNLVHVDRLTGRAVLEYQKLQ